MEEMKKRIPNAEDKYPIEIEIGLVDEKTNCLVRWPGYPHIFENQGWDMWKREPNGHICKELCYACC